MPVLEKIRSKAGIFIAGFIGFALLAFILGDFFNSGRSLFRRSQEEVGKINGKTISTQEYSQLVDELSEVYKIKTNQTSLQDEELQSVKDQAWIEMIFANAVQPEYDELGLAVGKDELADLVNGNNPSPIIRQNFGDPQTGTVNRAQVAQIWNNYESNEKLKTIVLSIEKDITLQREFAKYTNLIRKGIYVPKFLAKNDFVESNEKVDVGFIVKRFSEIPDSAVKITSSDLKEYYNSHKYLFEQTPSRDIEYVTFDIKPSDADYKSAIEAVNKMLPDFSTVSVDNAKQYVSSNSDIPFDKTFVKPSQLTDTLSKVMASAKEGDVFGPYFENETYKVARLVKIANIPDSVKARHILVVPSENSQAGVAKAKERADSIKTALEKGADFTQLAAKFSADKGSVEKGGDLGWFQEGRMVPTFNDAAFSMNKGEYRVVESQYGFHIIQVTDRGPEVKKLQVAYLARKVNSSTNTHQAIYSKASKFASENRTKEQFDNSINASKGQVVKKLASSITINDRTITGLEQPRELIRWAYNASKSEVSDVIQLPNAFVVAVVSDIREGKFATLDQVQSEVELAVRKDKKGEMLAAKINKEKQTANSIQDLANKLNTTVESASGISFSSFSIGSAGIEPKLIATSLYVKPNQLSDAIAGNNGVYVAYVTSKAPAEGTDFSQSQFKLNNMLQYRSASQTLETLKKLANIEDRRGKFF